MPDPSPHAVTPPDRTASGSLAPAYFDRLYAESPDPWGFETSPYEAAKYAATLAALPHERYASALEVGCSIGVLTELLAARCDRLLALDVSEPALARARARCAALEHVRFEALALPHEVPPGPFGLVLLSEVGYYLSAPDLALARARLAETLAPGGHLVLVHWTGETDYPLSGDAVHHAFLADVPERWAHLGGTRAPAYRLDVFERQAEHGAAGCQALTGTGASL